MKFMTFMFLIYSKYNFLNINICEMVKYFKDLRNYNKR